MSLRDRWSEFAALAVGYWVLAWVGAGFVGHSTTALLMTCAMAVVLAIGALELSRFQRDTETLQQAIASRFKVDEALSEWLLRVPSALRATVRQRVEGERAGLPGPVVTPYLVGLLVMLGMLGTFIGMVMTFTGAMSALEGSADLLAVRAALAAPIKGLSLSFGTSVAGVASSAALGWMLVCTRRARLEAGRQLDALVQAQFGEHAPTRQRQAMLTALRQQSDSWPAMMDRMQALIEGLAQRDEQTQTQLLAQQQDFNANSEETLSRLAKQMSQVLRDSAIVSARAAGEAIQAPVQSLVQDIASLTQQLQAQQLAALQQQQTAWIQALDAQVAQLTRQWQLGLENHQQRMDVSDQERVKWTSQLQERQTSLAADAALQRELMAKTSQHFDARLSEQADLAQALTARMSGSAEQLGQLGATFERGVAQFSASNERLMTALNRVDGALQQAMERSDEQLAYYVGQAREVVDLCLASQQRVLEDLQRLRANERQTKLVQEAA